MVQFDEGLLRVESRVELHFIFVFFCQDRDTIRRVRFVVHADTLPVSFVFRDYTFTDVKRLIY